LHTCIVTATAGDYFGALFLGVAASHETSGQSTVTIVLLYYTCIILVKLCGQQQIALRVSVSYIMMLVSRIIAILQ
jgi:hypothetical protein